VGRGESAAADDSHRDDQRPGANLRAPADGFGQQRARGRTFATRPLRVTSTERLYSGLGGQPDFTVGALHSPGGNAIIALRSWHEKSNSSTIVPRLTDPATSFQHSAVITEQGCAQIFGRSQRAQARLITECVAHPDAREWLREEAASMGLGARVAARAS